MSDVDWLADVGTAGLVVLMKDKRIRTRPAEQAAVVQYSVRCFCASRGDLTGEQIAAAFVAARPRIERACRAAGPFIYQVHANGLTKVL